MKNYLFAALLSTAFIVASFSCKSSTSTNDGFTITGTVEGYPDNTMLYLVDRSKEDSKTIDSAAVKEGHFKFGGTFAGKTLYATIQTKTLSDYKFLWLEKKAMTFKAVKGKFRAAIITGSDTQDDDNSLTAVTDPLFEKTRILGRRLDSASKDEQKVLSRQIDSIHKVRREIDRQFIKNHPASVVSLNLLSTYSTAFGKEKTAALYKNLSQELKDSENGKSILKYLTVNKKLEIGDHYADFSALDPAGKPVKISDYAGKIFLIDFWASWCVPCRANNPVLVKTYSAFKDKGFEIIGVSIDRASDKNQWIAAIKKDGLTWPNISQLAGDKCEAALMYGIVGIPDNFLVDKNGIILARNLRGEDLDNKLKELLK